MLKKIRREKSRTPSTFYCTASSPHLQNHPRLASSVSVHLCWSLQKLPLHNQPIGERQAVHTPSGGNMCPAISHIARMGIAFLLVKTPVLSLPAHPPPHPRKLKSGKKGCGKMGKRRYSPSDIKGLERALFVPYC